MSSCRRGAAGPYKNVAPFSAAELRVHYQNNYPFMTLTDVVREVEVSHWGHIFFEEHVSVAHTGAQLKVIYPNMTQRHTPTYQTSRRQLLLCPAALDLVHSICPLTFPNPLAFVCPQGGFSRLDYQRNPPAGTPSHFRVMVAKLPASSYSLYYRDVIGNISTSRAHVRSPGHSSCYPSSWPFACWLISSLDIHPTHPG